MFANPIGNNEAKEALQRMLAAGRVPGSLLFTGEDGVGKKLFALELAKALNCRDRRGVEACDVCSSCVRISRSTFPPYSKEDDNKDRLIWSEHPDVAMARVYKRMVRVKPIRELEREANFRPYEGQARVFIIEDAERMNEAAQNALLKTLEEPATTSYLILITSKPAALLPTIRSRCQAIRFAPIPAPEIEKFLVEMKRMRPADAGLLAHTSRGSIGRALATDADTYREQREAMMAVLQSLVITGDRVALLRAAEGLNDAKRKDEFECRLDVLESLIRDAWALALGRPENTIANNDELPQLLKLAAGLTSHQAEEWLLLIETLREQLVVNINRKIATDALFLTMAAK
jgi:DNA polymerase-3 subunit delta'